MNDKQYSEYEEKAKALSGVKVYYRYDKSCKKTKKIQADESRVNETKPSSGNKNFRTNLYCRILDTLSVQ